MTHAEEIAEAVTRFDPSCGVVGHVYGCVLRENCGLVAYHPVNPIVSHIPRLGVHIMYDPLLDDPNVLAVSDGTCVERIPMYDLPRRAHLWDPELADCARHLMRDATHMTSDVVGMFQQRFPPESRERRTAEKYMNFIMSVATEIGALPETVASPSPCHGDVAVDE